MSTNPQTALLQIDRDARQPMTHRIYDALHQAIATGQYAPGQRLPARQLLADDLGVSLATVRDAYRRLEQQQLVVGRRGDGTYVREDALKQMQTSRHRTIDKLVMVLDVPSLAHCPREAAFITTDILDGIRQVLGEWDTRVMLVDAFTRSLLANLDDRSAVVLRTSHEADKQTIRQLLERGIPVVSAWNETRHDVPRITYDRYHAATLPCKHLVACGYRRIGYLGRKSRPGDRVESKFAAFAASMHEAGLDVHARYIREVHGRPGMAYHQTQQLIQSGDLPEAFFVDTDYKAMEVVAALNDAGLSVPGDVGIASYDDIFESATFHPPLTTIHIPRRAIGRCIADMLTTWPTTDRMPQTLPADVTLKANLVVRESTRQISPSGEASDSPSSTKA